MDPLSFENDPLLGDSPLLEAAGGDGQAGIDEEPESTAALVLVDGDEPAEKTERDLQRGALQELVELTARCAGLEIEIDRKFAESIAANETKDQRAHADLQRQLKNLQEQLTRKHAEILNQI